ncbi:super-infection exclusion protein B [Acinetobacter baumannii]|uniref:super-infection exclusion protein B n=1 Tax=Acinetobacter baumannii TaxID=470 RepID=UPI003891954A
MENLIKTVLDIFRTHNILLYVVAITSGLLSYNIFGVSDLTGYALIKTEFKNYVGLAFLVSTITILVLCTKSIINYIRDLLSNSSFKKQSGRRIKEKIENLTNQEKAVLLQFFIQESETIWMPFRTQEVVELMNSNILTLASNAARMTLVGEAAMLKLSKDSKQKLANSYPNIFSDNFNLTEVKTLVEKYTPNSVKEVNRDRRMSGY